MAEISTLTITLSTEIRTNGQKINEVKQTTVSIEMQKNKHSCL